MKHIIKFDFDVADQSYSSFFLFFEGKWVLFQKNINEYYF